ncbi:hypothetical protein FRC10_006788 [Ceratobasidium sp. 414]|nr:hypothetical protein FRC10_006788 [Ceratobasidium sp. 414]
MSSSKRDQHQARQQHEHAEAQKRKAERRDAHERRMRQQAEQAAQAKAERARRHQVLKEEEARRRKKKEARRGWGHSPASSGSSPSSWSECDFNGPSNAWRSYNWEYEGVARYEAGWERMKHISAVDGTQLSFSDIAWPRFQTTSSLHELSRQDIENFVTSSSFSRGRDKRVLLRGFILQWHPDKFIGRLVRNILPA